MNPLFSILFLIVLSINCLSQLLHSLNNNIVATEVVKSELSATDKSPGFNPVPSGTKTGLSERQGKRLEMEDAFCAELNNRGSFFGIFDGHDGSKAAIMAADNMPVYLSNTTVVGTNAIMCDIFNKAHNEILKKTSSGSTAIVAWLDGAFLHLGWIGDARAVLEENGGIRYATQDHSLLDPEEVTGIWERGGKVMILDPKTGSYTTELQDLTQLKLFANKKGYLRVDGILNLPRALGDRNIIGVGHKPSSMSFKLTPHNNFLILACDGVWDVLSNEEAVAIVKTTLQTSQGKEKPRSIPHELVTENGDPRTMAAARALIDAAYNRGSTDNISALVVVFNW